MIEVSRRVSFIRQSFGRCDDTLSITVGDLQEALLEQGIYLVSPEDKRVLTACEAFPTSVLKGETTTLKELEPLSWEWTQAVLAARGETHEEETTDLRNRSGVSDASKEVPVTTRGAKFQALVDSMPDETPSVLASCTLYDCIKCGYLTSFDIEDDGTCKNCGRFTHLKDFRK